MNKFVIRGLAVALIIAIVAPFLASSNPDGLESTAEKFNALELEKETFSSPFPDYTVPGLGGFSEVAAMLIGTAVVFIAAYGVAKIHAHTGNNKA